MKLLSTLFLISILISCKNINFEGSLHYSESEGLKIKELTKFTQNYKSAGSYSIGNDTVISKLEIESKYELLIIKLKNVAKNYKLNYFLNQTYSPSGMFTTVNNNLYDVNVSTPIFKNDQKINTIDLIFDKEINNQINNDTIKSFELNFHRFAIKINNQDEKIIFSEIEYYGLENLSANFLFYNMENETYLFILTPLNGKVTLKVNTIYNLLFPSANLIK